MNKTFEKDGWHFSNLRHCFGVADMVVWHDSWEEMGEAHYDIDARGLAIQSSNVLATGPKPPERFHLNDLPDDLVDMIAERCRERAL